MPDFCRVIPLFAFPEDIRKVISTTNATLVSQHVVTASVTRNQRIFPSDEAVFKVIAPFDPEHRQEMDDAHSQLEACSQLFCH